jgi:hypothetical protein
MRAALPALIGTALLAGVACKSKESSKSKPSTRPPVKAAPIDAAAPACVDQRFPVTLPIAEASGAVYVAGPRPTILVVGDSGTRGQLLEIAADTGKVLFSGRLPLDGGASDDLEGLTMRGDTLYGITSSGYLRHWVREGNGFRQTVSSYPVAPRGKPPHFVCNSAHATNCARNYEGMCLRQGTIPEGKCAGFLVSKEDGRLYCLVENSETKRLAVAPPRSIRISASGTLTGCQFAPEGDLLWVGTNFFGGSRVYTVSGYDDVRTATVREVAPLGSGFPEAIAVGPKGTVYRFSDTSSAPSLVDKFVCR